MSTVGLPLFHGAVTEAAAVAAVFHYPLGPILIQQRWRRHGKGRRKEPVVEWTVAVGPSMDRDRWGVRAGAVSGAASIDPR